MLAMMKGAEVKKMKIKTKNRIKEAGAMLLFAAGVNAPWYLHVLGVI